MSNPFKVGDKVVRKDSWCFGTFTGHETTVFTVHTAFAERRGFNDLVLVDGPRATGGYTGPWDSSKFRAAIAGQDYPVPTAETGSASTAVYQGHLPDGSSVQAHSAGGLYPVVLVYRDKVGGPDANGKYDVGVISPKNQDPIWFKSSDAAIAVAEAIKANL
jgi:hypothetical protein